MLFTYFLYFPQFSHFLNLTNFKIYFCRKVRNIENNLETQFKGNLRVLDVKGADLGLLTNNVNYFVSLKVSVDTPSKLMEI